MITENPKIFNLQGIARLMKTETNLYIRLTQFFKRNSSALSVENIDNMKEVIEKEKEKLFKELDKEKLILEKANKKKAAR